MKVELREFDKDLSNATALELFEATMDIIRSAAVSMQLPDMKEMLGQEYRDGAYTALQGIQIQLLATFSKAGLAPLEKLAELAGFPADLVRLVSGVAEKNADDKNHPLGQFYAKYGPVGGPQPKADEDDAVN